MYPEDLLYTKSHEWVKVEDDRAIVGCHILCSGPARRGGFVELPRKERKLRPEMLLPFRICKSGSRCVCTGIRENNRS